MLPLTAKNNYAATIQVCGGSYFQTNASDPRCIAINFGNSNPQWVETDPMPEGRLMADNVLLPDGTVLYTNGAGWGQAGGNSGQAQYAGSPVFNSYIFDPTKPSGSRFTKVASATVPRLYHSGALLLTDGRVMTSGSEMQNYGDYAANRADCFPIGKAACTSPFEYRLEAFSPPYLSLPQERPVIAKAPTSTTYGKTLIYIQAR